MTVVEITHIELLADEANTHDDIDTVALCEQALAGDPDALAAVLDCFA